MTQQWKGLPTRSVLIAAMVLVITSITISSLWVVRNRLERQVLQDFSGDLIRSVEIFRAVDAQRLAALRRENALLADLPSLKALMTTRDPRTISDGGVRFWTVSDSDLFALAASDGNIVAAYTRGGRFGPDLRASLTRALGKPDRRFLLTGDGRLYEYSVRPLYFGSDEAGTLLGYVLSGYAVDASFVRQTQHTSAAEVGFLSAQRIITSTLDPALWDHLQPDLGAAGSHSPLTVTFAGQRYLLSSIDLSNVASEPLHLVVMKSFAHAEQAHHELNRLLVIVGACALGVGTLLMLAVSGLITGPLEALTRTVLEYGKSAKPLAPRPQGTREVRELSDAFLAMSSQIREKSQALLEAERLATIGRMASSVSHDLRHYLAAVYANAEFLVDSRLSEDERGELFAEIRTAVHGTTDLIESLLIFSRSSGAVPRTPELLAHILERALILVRAHPDAESVQVFAPESCDPGQTSAMVDARQVERALYNLLLNACQAARGGVGNRRVTAEIAASAETVDVRIMDDGVGVADGIRQSLFEPFVSEGKQNGTGLGLTMAHVVAQEHGGSVKLVRSRPGETVFVLSIARASATDRTLNSKSALEALK